MNKKINSIKKRLLNVCTKLISSNTQSADNTSVPSSLGNSSESINQLNYRKIKKPAVHTSRSRIMDRKTSSIISKTNSVSPALSLSIIYRTGSKTHKRKSKQSSGSSGYGTSIKSTASVFMNLENYFYDENFSKIKDITHENSKQIKLEVIHQLLDYQIEYLSLLKSGLEKHIRPMSGVMTGKLYFEIFQNVEKIYTTTEFLRNSINESILLTMDMYTSTITVIQEYIQVIVNTYDIYLKGYAQSSSSITDKEFIDLLKLLSKSNFMNGFDLSEFIDLPIKNIAKIYCTFMSLLDMTPKSEEFDYARLTNICSQIKRLIEPSINQSLDSVSIQGGLTNFNSMLDNNIFKKKSQLNRDALNFSKTRSRVSSSKRRNIRLANNVFLPPVLSDFTGEDGKKYYFV